ncbi:unnamed protein product [Schistocephalus solidus]|uniref:Ion_trans domain-containing protein n=1 Tax=Schistocephalus solidus TaxID=70667 RepID=A0A183TAU1_SCHSO|nr:unnamed protein product [Schistocephalus solidus]
MQILPQYDTDNYADLNDEQTTFENFSVQLIERYYSEQPRRAVALLQLNSQYIPDQIACSHFICSLSIQYIVEHQWWNGFNANPVVIMVAFVCPVLVCTPLFSFVPIVVVENSPLLLAISGPSEESSKRRKPTCSEKFRKFYTAPITKFYTHALFYLAFIVFYAYTVAVGIRPNYVSIYEVIVVVGMISFFSENLFEGSCRYNSFVQTVINLPPFYKYDSVLNVLNVVTIILALGRFVPFQATKTLYVVSFVLHSFRFFKFYYFYSNLGPKLAMMGRMVKEMLEFLMFLLVFLLATGVAMEGLLYVNRTNFTMEVLRDIFLIQFYRLYGENNLELARGEVEGCTTPDGVNCPVSNPLAPWLLNLYLLIVVTLLMNLLIAIFSNVFDEFESESREIWKRTRCRLLYEFKEKTIFPMPFNVIERFIQLFIVAFRACQRFCRKTVTEHKMVHSTENTPLKEKTRDVDKQVKAIREQLDMAAKKAELKRMEICLQYIRKNCLPRFLRQLESDNTDVTTELLDDLQNTCVPK